MTWPFMLTTAAEAIALAATFCATGLTAIAASKASSYLQKQRSASFGFFQQVSRSCRVRESGSANAGDTRGRK
jgi:hypothetical protein